MALIVDSSDPSSPVLKFDLGVPAGASVDAVLNAAYARGVTSFRLPGTEVTPSGLVVIPNGSPPVSQADILKSGWAVEKVAGGAAFSALGSAAHAAAGLPGEGFSALGTGVHGATDFFGKYRWLIIGGALVLAYTVVKEAI